MAQSALFLHYEASEPEYTLKLVLDGSALSVRQALMQFSQAYAGTGKALPPEALTLSTSDGTVFGPDALLPCGLPPSSDLLVHSTSAPTTAEPAAIEAAPAALEAAALLRAKPKSAAASGPQVYAKAGSAIAASQAKMGENSYYYSVGKNRGTPAPAAAPRAPVAVVKPAPDAKQLPETTISSYSMIDDDAKVKINVPMAGAANLAPGAISATFRDRSFDLRVAHEGKCLRLHVPILLEEIEQHKCICKKRQGKLLIVLEKRDSSKPWYELRKTKGIGDTEFSKIVPDSGEAFEFTL